jgi:hypothetical protein
MKVQRDRTKRALMLANILTLLVIAAALFAPLPVYADDCERDPRNAADCMRSPGYRQGISTIVLVGATGGVIIINIFSQIPGGPRPKSPQVYVPPQPPAPTPEPPLQDSGWPPKPGQVNDKGDVWFRPPWDQGGEYWVPRSEYDNIRKMQSQGYKWSDTWGWKPPDEIQRMDADREARWKKFSDPKEGQKRHQKLMRDVQHDVQKNPEYQRMQRELDSIRQRLDDMQRQSIRDDMAFNQRMHAIYARQDRRLAIIEAPVKVIKVTADAAIDVLGAVPGGPRYIKWGYKAVTNFADKSISEDSWSAGFKAGGEALGKEIAGDLIGDKFIKTPSIDLPSVGGQGMKKLIQNTGAKEVGALGANWIKGQGISKTLVDPGYNAGKKIITGSKDPIITLESLGKNPYKID